MQHSGFNCIRAKIVKHHIELLFDKRSWYFRHAVDTQEFWAVSAVIAVMPIPPSAVTVLNKPEYQRPRYRPAKIRTRPFMTLPAASQMLSTTSSTKARSSASAMMRITSSVPLGRITTRPLLPNRFLACDLRNDAFGFKEHPLIPRF